MNVLDTYTVRLYMAGDAAEAKRVIRGICYEKGLCVTVERVDFIYTGGEEAGVAVGFVNYPRFPSSAGRIMSIARAVAEKLMPELNQKSALLVGSDKTEWITVDPPGALDGYRKGKES